MTKVCISATLVLVLVFLFPTPAQGVAKCLRYLRTGLSERSASGQAKKNATLVECGKIGFTGCNSLSQASTVKRGILKVIYD